MLDLADNLSPKLENKNSERYFFKFPSFSSFLSFGPGPFYAIGLFDLNKMYSFLFQCVFVSPAVEEENNAYRFSEHMECVKSVWNKLKSNKLDEGGSGWW